jgi:hypothetical protein
MPRLVDYGSRFAFLREAAFEVVRKRGVDALSRQSVANVQGVSASTVRRLVAADADLVVFAAEEVEARRGRDRWHVPRGTTRERVIDLLRRLIPDTDARIAEELVWWRIVFSPQVASGVHQVPPASDDSLRQRYQVAQRGYAEPPLPEDRDHIEVSAELTRMIDVRATEIDVTLTSVLDLLKVPEGEREQRLGDLRLLIEGIGVAVCTGRMTPAEAVQALERAAVTAA